MKNFFGTYFYYFYFYFSNKVKREVMCRMVQV